MQVSWLCEILLQPQHTTQSKLRRKLLRGLSSLQRRGPLTPFCSAICASMSSQGTPPSRILYVRNIPRDLDTKEVEELFKKRAGFLELRRVILFVGSLLKQCQLPQFAFVEFKSVE